MQALLSARHRQRALCRGRAPRNESKAPTLSRGTRSQRTRIGEQASIRTRSQVQRIQAASGAHGEGGHSSCHTIETFGQVPFAARERTCPDGVRDLLPRVETPAG